MIRRTISALCLLALLSGLGTGVVAAQAPNPGPAYHRPDEVNAALKSSAAKFPALAKVIPLGKSAGGRDILLLRIAASEPDSPPVDGRPAVLVAANLEGVHLIGTEAALRLADKLLAGFATDKGISAILRTRTVYVAPLLNPDAAEAFFAPIRWERRPNARPVDDDVDGAEDEDGFEDLNQDGLITQMRVKDPEGSWLPDPKDPRLMRQADPKKGEKGIFKLLGEGVDNDGDGEYNEDPPGGVEPNRNLPHDFEPFVRPAGISPVSEAETIALVRFMVDHPRIALVLSFSTENTILDQQQTGQAKAGGDKVKLPKMYAQAFGLDPEAEFTLKEVADAANALGLGGGMRITEEMVASFLGVGAAVQIDRQDQPLLDAVQKDYKDMLKAAKLDGLEKRPKGVGKGSFAAYVYFQYGTPVFSTDLWQVPEPKKVEAAEALTADKLKAMTADQFLALGEDKVDVFLKEAGAPANINAKVLLGMVRSGQLKPAQMAEMMEKMPKKPGSDGEDHPDAYILKWAETALKGKGFVPWTPVKHPQLGDVEIGGFAPFLRLDPPSEEMEATITAHDDFYIQLMGRLPVLKLAGTKAEAVGPGLYKVTALIANEGRFPTSTGQGRRARTAWPIRVELKLDAAQALLAGPPVEEIPVLNGGETKKVEWTVRGKKGSRLSVRAWSPKLDQAEIVVVLD